MDPYLVCTLRTVPVRLRSLEPPVPLIPLLDPPDD